MLPVLSSEQTIEVQKLFLQHHCAVKAFVYALLPDKVACDDVVQEAFVVVSERAEDFELGTNFFAWVCEIARRRVLAARRQHGRHMLSPDVLDSLLNSVPAQVFDSDRFDMLTRCLDRLPPRMQLLVKLRYLSEMRPVEIAAHLSRSLSGVNVALSKARLVLRECVDRELRREVAP